RAFSVAGLASLVVVSSALAGSGGATPKIPWAVPTAPLGNNPTAVVLNQATHTLYVANGALGAGAVGDISVVDSRRCNTRDASGCRPIATLDVSTGFLTLDAATDTLYVSTSQSVAVVDAATCNAADTSGCGQTPAAISFAGSPGGMALDAATHTLY